jgi:VIT1/CCC1 family predicted Fe2+/Mn2+ transporter
MHWGRYAWASPTTAVGLCAGVLTLCSRGKVQRRRGALEFHGGFSRWLAESRGFSAMTLGHVIIGRDEWSLDYCRDHEQAHVRQVERWGAMFIPAYLAASLVAWRRGGHYYLDNWFEWDARRACGADEPRWMVRPVEGLHEGRRREGFSMRPTRHEEQHFTASELVRDVVIGMSDGLTVPFALAAGLSGTDVSTAIVVTAGLGEVAAGSIAMGLGGYLAAKTEAEHYAGEKSREEREVDSVPHTEAIEVAEIFRAYGLVDSEIEPILDAFRRNPRAWVDFMMRFELGLEQPDPRRALTSASTIASAYIAGGLIPLAPYMMMARTRDALIVSAIVTLVALAVFGAVKGRFTGTSPIRSAWQTTLIGGIAAAAAFLIARMIA